MMNGDFPDNFSLSIPGIPPLLELTMLVAEITHRHFPEHKERTLKPQIHHICLVENIPETQMLQVAKEAEHLWQNLSVTVDRVYVVRSIAGQSTMEPMFFKDRLADNDIDSHVPNDPESAWLLANMFAHNGPIDSKLRLQKLLFLTDHEQTRRHRYDYVAQRYGPYSSEVEKLSSRLVSLGLLTIDPATYNHVLTERGAQVAGLCYTYLEDHERSFIAASMKKHGHRTTNDLLTYVHGEYPEWHVLGRNWPDD
jgi:hypothetical protein